MRYLSFKTSTVKYILENTRKFDWKATGSSLKHLENHRLFLTSNRFVQIRKVLLRSSYQAATEKLYKNHDSFELASQSSVPAVTSHHPNHHDQIQNWKYFQIATNLVRQLVLVVVAQSLLLVAGRVVVPFWCNLSRSICLILILTGHQKRRACPFHFLCFIYC